MKRIQFCLLLTVASFCSATSWAQSEKSFGLLSPNGKISITVLAGKEITWAVKHENDQVIKASAIALVLSNDKILGKNVRVKRSTTQSINTTFATPLYKKSVVKDQYNELRIEFNSGYGLIFRAYDDGVAYRFSLTRKEDLTIKNEVVNFNLPDDKTIWVPYVRDLRGKEQYVSSFESLYDVIKSSALIKDSLAFLPILVKINAQKKAVITEVDLESYPGMFISKNDQLSDALKGVFAPYPLEEQTGGFNNINYMVKKRADYMAKISGTRNLPWRTIVISDDDKVLLNNDMVQRLASPSRIKDVSWIKPGKVAWDWWNDWNLSKVDFKAGINTETYKYYIDFASKNKIEYVVLDEGWSNESDMMQVSDKINLKEIIAHAKQKNVSIILWASWYALSKVTDSAFDHYGKMGIKGFKVDFLDRDDQKMVSSVYEIAKKAAEHQLIIDFHGMYKPTGVQRTYPNVVNFEGVKGLENVKWTPADDVPNYDVTIPFIRMLAGPMDYTPGAMRNATKDGFKPSSSLPMSQGTRCHQLAMYVIFEAPLQMLADSPTAYQQEQECTDFIAQIPTIFDETVALDSKLGEYVSVARKKNDVWFAAGMSNWNARTIDIDLSFLGKGNYEAEIFKDGVNADRNATDYKKEVKVVTAGQQLKLTLANGGGFAIKFKPIK